MDELTDITEINLSQLPTSNPKQQVPSGLQGIELLMSGQKNNNQESNFDASFDKLENDLNELTKTQTESLKINNKDQDLWSSIFGSSSPEIKPNTNQYIPQQSTPQPQPIPKEDSLENMKRKIKLLTQLEELKRKNITFAKNYSMDDSVDELQAVIDIHTDLRLKKTGVDMQRHLLLGFVKGLEFFNKSANPFDFNLDGWSEATQENVGDYDGILEELYEKYKANVSILPELRLAFMLGQSAIQVHITNTLLKGAMPGMDEVLRQHPDVAKMLNQAAVQTMGNNNPKFANYINATMNQKPETYQPFTTQTHQSPFQPQTQPQTQPQPHPEPSFPELKQSPRPLPNQNIPRPEMKGPSDISHIFNNPGPVTHSTKQVKMEQPVKKIRRKKSDKVAANIGLTAIESSTF